MATGDHFCIHHGFLRCRCSASQRAAFTLSGELRKEYLLELSDEFGVQLLWKHLRPDEPHPEDDELSRRIALKRVREKADALGEPIGPPDGSKGRYVLRCQACGLKRLRKWKAGLQQEWFWICYASYKHREPQLMTRKAHARDPLASSPMLGHVGLM